MTWNNSDIETILQHLRHQGNDDGRFEAKSCVQNLDNSVWESVSAFANTNGGTLLLGVDEKTGFKPAKGFEPNRTISQFLEGMGDGTPTGARLTNPPEYHISRCENHGHPIVAIDIKPNPVDIKPCYITAKGPQAGGYRRVDDKDIRLSPTEIFEFEHALIPSPADRDIVPEATMRDLNKQALNTILNIHRDSKALRGATTRAERLARLNITDSNGGIRLAGLLAAGQYPQQYYPKLLIDVAAHPDVEKSQPGAPRFLDRALCDGNMPEAIDQAVETVARNLRKPTFVIGAGARTDTEIPREALREIIANAVVHREYDARFLGESVAVDIYPDRVEVTSPGGLWGGVTLDSIMDGESRCRNTTLIQLMHQIPYRRDDAVTVEGGGTGLRLVVRELEARALPAPKFEALPDHFKVTLPRYGTPQTSLPVEPRSSCAQDWKSDAGGNMAMADATPAEREILGVLSDIEPRGVHEISRDTGKSLQMVRKLLRSLVANGLVLPTAPATSRHREYLLRRR